MPDDLEKHPARPTTTRAGAGISYDFINLQSYQNEDNVAPFAGDTTVNGPINIATPWATTHS